MSDAPDSSEQHLLQVLHEYLQAVDAGKAPNRDELLRQHPDLAEELAAFLADQACLNAVAQPFQPELPPGSAPTLGYPASPVEAPGTQVKYFGNYEILNEIARGGMGVVYRARQMSLDRVVALKMILAGQLASDDEVRRFHAEAQTAAKLQHPNIVAIFEVGEHKGQHYFSMDYVEGHSLADLVRTSPLPPRQAARYVKMVADAIHYAHNQGVLHRDIKPSNVLIDSFDQPRVTDFGLARSLSSDKGLTATGAVVGTPSYMPPEQASADRGQMGPHSDVYSLGALLYELVTGRPPFRAATPLDTLMQVLTTDPAAPRLLNAAVDRDLETIVLKCLAKEPARRYPSAQELSDDLQAFLDGKPIKARPPSLPERLGIWLKQQGRTFKIAAATTGGAVLLLLALLLILDWQQHARMGGIELETDGTAMLAEVFAGDDPNPVAPPFTAPTRQPIHLPEGSYQLRVSGAQRLAETLPLMIERGITTRKEITLTKRRLGEPVPCSGVFAFVPRGAGHDILAVGDMTTLGRYDGGTGKLQWFYRPTGGDRETPWFFRPTGGDKEAPFFSTMLNCNQSARSGELYEGEHAPRLLRPLLDLDGDGVPDLVWADSTGTRWAAISGKEELQVLWSFRPTPWLPPDQAGFANTARAFRGKAGTFPASGDGGPLILGLFGATLQERDYQGHAPETHWAEGVDARTGRSVWRFGFEKDWVPATGSWWGRSSLVGPGLAGPWVVSESRRSVFVCVAGSHLIGLDPATGKQVWEPVDLGFVPDGTPTLAAEGNRGIILLTRAGVTVHAVSLPTGKVLWSHRVPSEDNMGWIRHDAGGFLTDPLLIDLDGAGNSAVLVPGEHGTITLLDAASGKVRWHNSVGINQGRASAARVLVGPDLDGDGCRDIIVANVVAQGSRTLGHYFHPVVRLQALSGRTGEPLWRTHVRITNDSGIGYMDSGVGAPLVAWQDGSDGRPMVVVPANPHTLVVEASTGKVVHLIQDLFGPYQAIDLDGDGVPELVGYQFAGDDWGTAGRVGYTAFAGSPQPGRQLRRCCRSRKRSSGWTSRGWTRQPRNIAEGTLRLWYLP
jgi:outer membrane protein assembly factor BamB